MEAWEQLFDQAMRCLDSIRNSDLPMPKWSFGGGTALMLHYHHRASHDVDIFLEGPQWFPALSPRLNDVALAITDDYTEDTNFLKLVTPSGEIDFIAAQPLTRVPARTTTIHGRLTALETPAEIIAKKLRYRGALLRSRDVVDTAVALQHDPAAIWETRNTWIAEAPAIERRLITLRMRYFTEIEALALLPASESVRAEALNMVGALVSRALHRDRQTRQISVDTAEEPDR